MFARTAITLAIVCSIAGTSGQIHLDGSLGPSIPLTGPHYSIPAELGQRAGPNLFHSFRQFNLSENESALFSGPNAIKHIFARITDPAPSHIDGHLASSIPGAHLFLMNPAGILVGPNARLNLAGGLTLTTANCLRLAQGQFDASLSRPSLLSAAPLEAFGFTGPGPSAITIQGSQLITQNKSSLNLVGGPLHIRSAHLHAPDSEIQLHSRSAPGEIKASPSSRALDLPTHTSNPAGGSISITANSTLDAGSGNRPHLRGNTPPLAPTRNSGGGQITISTGTLHLQRSQLFQTTENSGTGGGIDIQAQSEITLDRSTIATTALGPQPGGNLRIQAGKLHLANRSHVKTTTALSTGRGGDLVVAANDFVVTEGSELGADSLGPGDTGSLQIQAGRMTVNGGGSTSETTVGTSSFSPGAGGRAGEVHITADELSVSNQPGGGLVGVGSRTFGLEPSGDVSVNARKIQVNGFNADGYILDQSAAEQTAIGSVNFAREAGRSGNVQITADELELLGYGIISAATFGRGDAGHIQVNASRILLDNSSIVSSTARHSTGHGGNVHVQAPHIEIRNHGGIAARTSGHGDAGNVLVQSDHLKITRHGSISAEVMPQSGGQGGSVSVAAQDISISDHGRISAETQSSGDGGHIQVLTRALTLQDHGHIITASSSSGNSGKISVQAAHSISIQSHSAISTEARFSDAQGIDLRAGYSLAVAHGRITSQAALNGGEVRLQAGKFLTFTRSAVSSRAGTDGGNIFIDPQFVILNQSTLDAGAIHGKGGNIQVISHYLLPSADSTITASSQFGVAGRISLLGPIVNPSGGLIPLPAPSLAFQTNLPPHCQVKLGSDLSSFVIRRSRLPQ